MEFIKPREGFFQNIVNYTVVLDCIKEKLKGCEDLFYFEQDHESISIYCKVEDLELLMLSKLAYELNKSLANGADLFVYDDSSKRVSLNLDYVDLCVDKDGVFDKLGETGLAVVRASDILLRPGRVDTDLRDFVSLLSDWFGFIDDDGADIQDCLNLDYAQGDWAENSESLELMYSIRCSTPEIAEEFAKKWVAVFRGTALDADRYKYLLGTMVDPALLNPNYQGYNRVYGDPSVLIGFVHTDRLMSCEHVHIFDKSQLPSKSDWWFK